MRMWFEVYGKYWMMCVMFQFECGIQNGVVVVMDIIEIFDCYNFVFEFCWKGFQGFGCQEFGWCCQVYVFNFCVKEVQCGMCWLVRERCGLVVVVKLLLSWVNVKFRLVLDCMVGLLYCSVDDGLRDC